MKEILVLGGGAAGIVAAIAAAEADPQAHVLLLEKNPRIGKKLLATGNGRCNLDNENISPDCYFTSDKKRMEQLLCEIEKAEPLDWFRNHGLLCRSDEAGRIYPYSNQAADVLNLLLHWLEKSNVEVRCDCSVSDIDRKGAGYQVIANGEKLYADAVICAMGGKAGPQFGTDGFALELARLCGCNIMAPYPCLVPLNCDKKQISGLSGVRVKGDASLYDGDKLLRKESGEIQFTDYGISGIAVFNLSGLLNRVKQPVISLDLFPQWSEEQLRDFFMSRSKLFPEESVHSFMTGLVHHRVGSAVWKAQNLGKEERKVSTLNREEWGKLAYGFKNWQFSQLSPTDWKNAQTTVGGIALSHLEDSFQLKNCPGLYFVGETVDCAGACGGFNLHWCFGSGILAGRHAASYLKSAPKAAKPAKASSKTPAKKKKR